jgi:predicted DNA-binding transcriptional regulator YafY
MTAVRLTEKEIHNILFGIHSLSASQRQLVQDMLLTLKSDGGMYRQEFERTLRELRKDHTISEIDRQNLEEAFGQFFQ